MENNDDLVAMMKKELEFLKSIQLKMVDNHEILLQNNQHNFQNMDILTKNLGIIIKNQDIIVNNQISIINNQKQIVSNQITLNVMLRAQATVLNLVNNLSGKVETMEETMQTIQQFKEEAQLIFNQGQLTEPRTL